MTEIRRLPMSMAKRRRLAAARRRVDCEILGRSLCFPDHAVWEGGTHLTKIDVLAAPQTDIERVLCQLIVSKEALLRVLEAVRNVRGNGNRL